MVTNKAWGLLGITASLFLGGAMSYADSAKNKSTAATGKVRPAVYRSEEIAAPPTKEVRQVREPVLDLGSAKPCPTEVVTFAVPEKCCPTPSRNHLCKFWDWLTYRPVTHTVVCGTERSCIPPLFAYNLEYCQLPPAPKIGHPGSSCVNSRCGTKPAKEEVAEKAGFSLLPRSLFGLSSDKRAAKSSTDKSTEHTQVNMDEVQTASRKVVVEAKKVEEEQLMGGKESSKWRGMPARSQEAGRR